MEPSKWIVILTGITLVFAILVLLTFIIKVQGKIFTGIDRKKAAAAAEAKAQPAPAASAAAPVAVSAAPAAPAAVEPELVAAIAGAACANANAALGGVPGEIVAAITAAVAAVSEGPFEILSITKNKQKAGRSAWSRAAVRAYTEPF